MKSNCRVIALSFAFSVLIAGGCRTNEDNDTAPGGETKTTGDAFQAARGEAELIQRSHSSYEVRPGVGMGPIRFGMSAEDVIERFGAPEKTQDDGMSLMYPSAGFSLMVTPKRGVQMINCYTKVAALPSSGTGDFAGKTREGIGMGASRSEIQAAYGEPDSEEASGEQTTMIYHELGIQFILLRDQLAQFFMNVPR